MSRTAFPRAPMLQVSGIFELDCSSAAPFCPVAFPIPRHMLRRSVNRAEGRTAHMDRISLYCRNATAEAVGERHGVTDDQLKQLAPRVAELTRDMAQQRKAGKLRYRDLPFDEEMVDQVNRAVEDYRDRCEVLIV